MCLPAEAVVNAMLFPCPAPLVLEGRPGDDARSPAHIFRSQSHGNFTRSPSNQVNKSERAAGHNELSANPPAPEISPVHVELIHGWHRRISQRLHCGRGVI